MDRKLSFKLILTQRWRRGRKASSCCLHHPRPSHKLRPRRPRRPLTWPHMTTGFCWRQERRRGRLSWRRKRHAERATEVADACDRLHVFEEAFEKVAKDAATKKPSGYSSEDDTGPNKSPDCELYEVLSMRSSVDCVRCVRRCNPRRRMIWQTKFARSSPKTVTWDSTHPQTQGDPHAGRPQRVWVVWRAAIRDLHGSMAGSSGRKSASNALSVSFGDDHAMENMRARIATRKEKKKQVAEEASKSLSSKGKASTDLKKATTCQGSGLRTRLGSTGKQCHFF